MRERTQCVGKAIKTKKKNNILDLKNSQEMKLSCFSIKISLYLGVTNYQISLHFGVPDNCNLKYIELVVGDTKKRIM